MRRRTPCFGVDPHIRCECGARATRRVWFVQHTPDNARVLTSLPVCEDCCAEMLAEDPGASLTRARLLDSLRRSPRQPRG